MKNMNEIRAIIDNLNQDTFDALNDAWYDDEKACKKLLKKIGLTMAEFENWMDSEEYNDCNDGMMEEEEEEEEFFFTFKITKKEAKKLMTGEYIDALAYFANILSDFEEAWKRHEALEIIDHVMWEKIIDFDETDNWMRVYTGLMMNID